MRYRLLCAFALASTAQAQGTTRPLPANGRFSSVNYGITFVAPPGLSYCPVAKNWTGTDHGTILFLIPPRRCTGTGYAASERGAEPGNLPHIEIYYGYRIVDDPRQPPCRKIGETKLLGHRRPLCARRDHASVIRTVQAHYRVGEAAELAMTLVTTRQRLTRDMKVFIRLLGATRTCATDFILPGGRHEGSGPLCRNGDFY